MKEIGDHFIEKISVDIYSKSVENAKSIEQNIDAFNGIYNSLCRKIP